MNVNLKKALEAIDSAEGYHELEAKFLQALALALPLEKRNKKDLK